MSGTMYMSRLKHKLYEYHMITAVQRIVCIMVNWDHMTNVTIISLTQLYLQHIHRKKHRLLWAGCHKKHLDSKNPI